MSGTFNAFQTFVWRCLTDDLSEGDSRFGRVDANKFRSKGRNTPYNGWTLKGKVVLTICGGRIVFGERNA